MKYSYNKKDYDKLLYFLFINYYYKK